MRIDVTAWPHHVPGQRLPDGELQVDCAREQGREEGRAHAGHGEKMNLLPGENPERADGRQREQRTAEWLEMPFPGEAIADG